MVTFLTLADGHKINYIKQPGQKPGVLFLGGYRSDLSATKAVYLSAFCAKRNLEFVAFEYFGHGNSTGDFEQGTISRWLQDAEIVLQQLTTGPQLIVGSSMGGYIMCLLAQKYPHLVRGLIGIAPAIDFVAELMEARLTEVAKKELEELGYFNVTAEYTDKPYRVYQKFLEDAREYILFNTPLNLNMPIRLLHGTLDDVVPWQFSERLLQQVTSIDVELLLIKNGCHRLHDAKSLLKLKNALVELLASTS